MEETRADESLPWFKQRVRQPPNQLRLFGGYGQQLTLRLFVVGGACPDLPKHECTHETHHSRTTIKLKTSEALPHRRSASVYTDQNESRHGEVIPTGGAQAYIQIRMSRDIGKG